MSGGSKASADAGDRVATARARCAGTLARLFAQAGLSYPARTVLLRAFKHERLLEVWGTNEAEEAGRLRLIATYPVLGASGGLGPKRREGDQQVPEGFYRVDRSNPRSRFHLSLGLDYPNAADRLLTTQPLAPGSDIFIHGGSDSRGCLAMGDAAMEEIYLVAQDAGAVCVHLFPCRMDQSGWRDVLSAQPEQASFWRELQAVYDAFESTRCLPRVAVDREGSYFLPFSAGM